MICFVNFARIASIRVGFDLGTLHGYFFHQDFWPNLNFPLESQITLVLTICLYSDNLITTFMLCLGKLNGVILNFGPRVLEPLSAAILVSRIRIK